MEKKINGKVTCIQCGYGCGYRRDTPFGGCSYAEDEKIPDDIETRDRTIPVDENDVCIYLEVLDNGFTKCTIHEKKPKMCKLFYCNTKQKARQLQTIVDELWRLPL